MSPKLRYLLTSAKKFIGRIGTECPSCGQPHADIVSRKYVITALRRCRQCKLLFRTPTTTAEENLAFYQEEYIQGFTTELPNDEKLQRHLESGFKQTEKDYSTYISVLEAIGCKRGDKLLDFGCSWGYGAWQLGRHGFLVESFEVSLLRAEFARKKLGINVFSRLAEVTGPYDIFFSSHVLEHVPSVGSAIDFGLSVLRSGGVFVAFTPNGSGQYRVKDPKGWYQLWGLVHPNFLDDVYYKNKFSKYPMALASNPYDLSRLMLWQRGQSAQVIHELSGGELLVAVRKQ